MRSTTKCRLDVSRVFHGLRPFREHGQIMAVGGLVVGAHGLRISPCVGDQLFAPVREAAPAAGFGPYIETKEAKL